MEEYPNETTPTPLENMPGKRPPGLTFLCILSFIGSGISAISSFFIVIAYDLIPYAVKESPFVDAASMVEMIKAAGPVFFALMGVLYLASLTGAILMFRLRKPGFHMYTLAQLLMLLLPSLMIDGFVLPVSSMLLTGSFVLAYAVNLRFMR